MVEANQSGKMRQIYTVDKAVDIENVRCTAIDVDNVLVVGNSKGYITGYE